MTAASLLVAVALVALVSGAGAVPLKNPFFAMDTCTKPRYPASDTTVDAQLDLVKETGYAGIAWTLGDPAETRAVAEGARKRGMRLYALYASVTLRRTGLEEPPNLRETIDALRGSDCLLWVHVGSPDFARSSPEGDAIAVPGLRALADYAAARRVRIALYPHVGDWTERVQDAVRVAKAVGRKNVGVTFNLCHCLQVGDEAAIPDLLRDAAPYLFAVTVNGADAGAAGAAWDRLIRPLDTGTYDLGALLRRLAALRYRGPIGLQGFGEPGDARENLTRSMAAWRRLTAR